MKRDMDLIRTILLEVESHEHGYYREHLLIDGYTEEQIRFHCWLIGDAGLAHCIDANSLGDESPQAEVSSLTWAGYEFLDAARSDSVWESVKTRIKASGAAVTFAVLTDLLVQATKQRLGITNV